MFVVNTGLCVFDAAAQDLLNCLVLKLDEGRGAR